jgi:predicted type IV restriction endonuclease
MLLNIDFLKYKNDLDIEYTNGQKYIYDIIRKKYMVLTPEELVRQLVIYYLIESKGYPKNKIRVEMGLEVNTLTKRCDILIFNKELEPIFLVECKSAKIKIDQKVFEQIATYNMTLKVPYLFVTNGPDSYCAEVNHKDRNFKFLEEVPGYSLIK